MKKIMIIGSPGSGKSTFSRKLKEKTGIPIYHLDMIYHKPDKTTVEREVFDACLSEILKKDEWIIDGNYSRTIEMRLHSCDTVFLFDLPTEVCLSGVEARIGKKREDMPWIEEEFEPEFKSYIESFKETALPKIFTSLEKYKEKNIIVFNSRNQTDDFILSLQK